MDIIYMNDEGKAEIWFTIEGNDLNPQTDLLSHLNQAIQRVESMKEEEEKAEQMKADEEIAKKYGKDQKLIEDQILKQK